MAALELGDQRSRVLHALGSPEKRITRPTQSGRRLIAIGKKLGLSLNAAQVLIYVGVDVVLQHGSVLALVARRPYQGCTSSGLHVGMRADEIERSHGDLMFDNERYVWLVPGWPTLELKIRRIAKPNEQDALGGVEELYELQDHAATVYSIAVQRERELP